MPTQTRGAAARTLELYRCIATGPEEFTLKSLADELKLPQSTVHRLLAPWVQRDLLERSAARHYRFGPELFRLAALVQRNFGLPRLARPALSALWKTWQETTVLCLFNPSALSASVAESLSSPQPLRYELPVNSVISLAWGSLGRVILAHLSESEIDAVLMQNPVGPVSGTTLPPRRTLLRELAQIRAQRYARFHNEVLNIAGVSAAVLQGHGRVIGSIGVIMPGSRFTRAVQNQLPSKVMAAARMLSAALTQ